MPKSPEERKRVKYAEYMRNNGTPLYVTQEERARLVRHLSGLKAAGMSDAQIAASAPGGRSESQVGRILGGRTRTTHRNVYNDLMQARYERPVQRKSGTKVDSVGTVRRLRALVAAGFTQTALGDMLGCTMQAVFQLVADDRAVVQAATAARVAELYEKLQCADPASHCSPVGVARAKAVGRRNNWPGPACWDVDTIDDPAALPEWTGRCGTVFGWHIHQTEQIPVCQPCADAHDAGSTVFSGARLRALRESRGWSRIRLANEVGVNPTTLQYWETGRSVPTRQNKLDSVLRVLDATYEDVCEKEQ